MRRFSLMLAAVLTVSLLGAPPAQAYEPTPGGTFNVPDPWGTSEQNYRIVRTVLGSIEHAPRWERTSGRPKPVIALSMFLLDHTPTVDALIQACRRGVAVRVILDEDVRNWNSRRLAQKLNGDNVRDRDGDGRADTKPATGPCGRHRKGTNPGPGRQPLGEPVTWGRDSSYVKWCSGSCGNAGDGGNVHTKMYLFSRTGTSRHVVMVSSSNLNRGGANLGWNDLIVLKDRPKSYDYYLNIHKRMTAEKRAPTTLMKVQDGRYLSRFFPLRDGGKRNDPTLRDLNSIRCHGSPLGRTKINVSMFYWAGKRGNYIADKLLGLARDGCQVSIIYGAPSRLIADRMRTAARADLITLYDSRWDFDDDDWNEVRTHAKYVLVKGRVGSADSTFQVWTGSQNWVSGSLTLSDESTVNVTSAPLYRQYMANWTVIRDHSRKIPQPPSSSTLMRLMRTM